MDEIFEIPEAPRNLIKVVDQDEFVWTRDGHSDDWVQSFGEQWIKPWYEMLIDHGPLRGVEYEKEEPTALSILQKFYPNIDLSAEWISEPLQIINEAIHQIKEHYGIDTDRGEW